MSRTPPALGLAFAVLSIPAAAAAQPGQPPPPPPGSSPSYGYGAYGMTVPGVREHDGFFLRMGLGAGYLRSSTEVMDQDVAVKGPAVNFQLALGGNLAPGLILYGEIFGNGIADPTVEFEGEEVDTEDTSLTLAGVGIGLAYYLPVNVYFSGTLAATRLTWTDNTGPAEEEYDSELGPAVVLQVGKEWWVSDQWGLGLAGQLLLSSNKDDEDAVEEVTWTTPAFSLLFSATYD
jgi:hypothetical protein